MWTHITYTSNWLDVEREKKQTAKKVAINSTNKQCNLFSYFICFVFITQLIKCVRLSFTAIDFGIIQSFQYLPYQIDRYRCKTECSLFLRMKCILCTACVFLVHCAWWTGKYVAFFFCCCRNAWHHEAFDIHGKHNKYEIDMFLWRAENNGIVRLN